MNDEEITSAYGRPQKEQSKTKDEKETLEWLIFGFWIFYWQYVYS